MAKKPVKNRFSGKTGADAERQQREASSYGYLQLPKSVKMFSPGRQVLLDFLPYEVADEKHPDRNDKLEIAVSGELWYKRPFKTHRSVGPQNETVVCPMSVGKRCPICEYRSDQIKQKAAKKDTDVLRPSRRNLYAVIPHNDKEHDEVVHLWDISQFCFQDLLNEELTMGNGGGFPDPESGLRVSVRFRTESIETNTFQKASRIDFQERDEPIEEDVLKMVPNLDGLLIVHAYKKLEAMFHGMDDEDQEKEGPESKSGKRAAEASDDDDVGEPAASHLKRSDAKEKQKSEDEDENEKNLCSYGHRFGIDTDKKPECKKCDDWSECIDLKDSEKG